MNIKNFLKKYRIHLIYGINMIPSYLLYSTFTDIVFDIKHEYSYRNQLIAVELIFLLLSFILIFSLYKYYKRKYKKILIGLIILNMALFSAIIINTISILPNDQESFYGYTSYYMLLIYWTIHMFSWGFYQKQDKIRLNLFKDSE